jgi:RimJ/RimL family protein N-acetyltransferase
MNSRQAPHPLTNLDLLMLAAELSMDDRRRLAGICGVTIAAAMDGYRLFAGSDLPDALVPALVEAVERSSPGSAPDREPPVLAACRAMLEPACTPLAVDAGPYYVFESSVGAETRAEIVIVRSDASSAGQLRRLNPGNWEGEEWDELLDGNLGPWAIAVVDGRVVSICHTPVRMTERAAECGVWTHPEYRGRGYAAAVTAAWAEILRPSGRFLFYSTDAGNRSSQRVAARLRLRPIGWTWRLTGAGSGPRSDRHPLSRRSSSAPVTPDRAIPGA